MVKYLKKYWLWTILAPLFMIGEVSMDLIQPELMSRIIDDGVLGINNGGVGSLDIVLGFGLKMVLFVAIGGLRGVIGAGTNRMNVCRAYLRTFRHSSLVMI